jgi:hypothetical protein
MDKVHRKQVTAGFCIRVHRHHRITAIMQAAAVTITTRHHHIRVVEVMLHRKNQWIGKKRPMLGDRVAATIGRRGRVAEPQESKAAPHQKGNSLSFD